MHIVKNTNIYSIIPARGGSKGVPGKNIKLLGGYPLIAYSIAASMLSKKINRTIVTTDSEEIRKIAIRYGAEIPFLRPKELALDNSTDFDYIYHALNWLKENEDKTPDYLVLLRPTTPLREPDVIDEAIEEILKKPEATSLRSAHPASESPFKWFSKDDSGFFKGIVPGYSNDQINLPRQNFPDVYIPNGYVDILKSSFVMETKTLLGDKMVAFVTSVCHEVDTLEEFEYLKFLIESRGSSTYYYLKNNYEAEV